MAKTVTLTPTTNTGGTGLSIGTYNQGISIVADKGISIVADKGKSITISKILTKEPKSGDLKPGEIGSYVDSKGKTVYYVGDVNGQVSKKKSVSDASDKLQKVIKSAEKAQITNLKEENKIEITEIKKTLADKGLSKKEIDAAVKLEEKANKDEQKQAETLLLKSDGYQTLSRVPETGLLSSTPVGDIAKGLPIPVSFNTTAVTNPDGSKTVQWNSLSYNGTAANEIKNTITKTLDDVNNLKVNYGLTGDIYTYNDNGDSQTTTGISNAALYSSLRNGFIKYDDATKNFYIDYSQDKINTGRDENGFGWTSQQLRKDGGKGYERGIASVLNRDTAIGDKAFTTTDKKGNIFIAEGADGKAIKGNSLKDTGQTDSAGNKIFLQTSNSDTKYNKVTINSVYLQNKDGSFTYMGSPDIGYTHIDEQDSGFSFGGFIAKALVTAAASYFGTPFLGKLIGSYFNVSDVAANAIASALIGGGISAATGSNLQGVLTDSFLAGAGSAIGDVLSKASSYYGGWTNLADELYRNPDDVWNGIKNLATASGQAAGSGINLGMDAVGNIINASTGGAFTQPGIDITTDTALSTLKPGIDLTTGAAATAASDALAKTDSGLLNNIIKEAPIDTGATVGDLMDAKMPDLASTVNAVDTTLNPIAPKPGINLGMDEAGNIVDANTGKPFADQGINLALDAAGNVVDATTGLPFTGTGVNLINPDTGTYVTPPPPFNPYQDLDTMVNNAGTGNNPYKEVDRIVNEVTNPVNQTTTTGGGLLDTIQNVGNQVVDYVKENPLTSTTIGAGLIATPAVIDKVQELITPTPPTTPNYPPINLNLPTPNNNIGGLLAMPTWWQNLYERQGAGAGNYLGYDVLRNLNLPMDVLGLLGSGYGQNTGSTFTP